MNLPAIPIPPAVRFVLYVVSAVGSALVAYLLAKGLIGDAETGLWAALVAIVNAVAASNTTGAYVGEHKAE